MLLSKSLVLILFILAGACGRPTPKPPIPSPVPLATPSSSKIESAPKKELKTSRLTLREIKSFAQTDPAVKRADAVKAYLIKKGIPEDRLSVKGYGANKPEASDETAVGRAANRRVDFTVEE